jgi:hypothetical protein
MTCSDVLELLLQFLNAGVRKLILLIAHYEAINIDISKHNVIPSLRYVCVCVFRCFVPFCQECLNETVVT